MPPDAYSREPNIMRLRGREEESSEKENEKDLPR
jgi:hypothetical protein